MRVGRGTPVNHWALAIPAAITVALVLGGCVHSPTAHRSTAPTVLPTPSVSESAPAPVPSPTYDPQGTAQSNLAFFDSVGHALLDHNPTANSQGETIVKWFVSHGFDKSQMQVTPDKTSVGLAAWNIEFSVKFGNSCLLGQAGNVGFHSSMVPALATGKCLVGQTRPITW